MARQSLVTMCVLGAAQVFSLARAILVARVIGPELRGEVVPAEILVAAFVALAAIQGPWQLVRQTGGSIDRFQGTLQSVMILNGILVALFAVVASWIWSGKWGPVNNWVVGLSMVSVCQGLENLGVWRALRGGRTRAYLWVELTRPVLGLGIGVCLAVLLKQSAWVLIGSLALGAAGRMLVSHMLCGFRVAVGLSKSELLAILRFSWPLAIAGFVHWVGMSADKVLLVFGAERGLISSEEVGGYVAVLGLVMLPLGVLGKSIDAIVIPRVSSFLRNGREDLSAFERRLGLILGGFVAAGAIAGTWIGPQLFISLLGSSFEKGASLSPVFLSGLGLVILRHAVYQISVAKGKSGVQLGGNLVRLCSLPVAGVFLWSGAGTPGLAIASLLGEAVSLVFVVYSSPLSRQLRALLLSGGAAAILAALVHTMRIV